LFAHGEPSCEGKPGEVLSEICYMILPEAMTMLEHSIALIQHTLAIKEIESGETDSVLFLKFLKMVNWKDMRQK
jgi:hypothetical protein